MPISKTKLTNAAVAVKSVTLPPVPKELLDQFVTGPMTGEAANAASMAFKKALIERALPEPSFIALPLAPPAPAVSPTAQGVRIELHRGPMAVKVTWPVSAAPACASWLRELLR